jgi:hypothetical protein
MMPLSIANTQAEIDALVGKGYTLDQAVAATELQRLSTSDSVRIGVLCLFEVSFHSFFFYRDLRLPLPVVPLVTAQVNHRFLFPACLPLRPPPRLLLLVTV